MACPTPFTCMNVITATMDILNDYPQDEKGTIAKANLDRLRQRMGYTAPECQGENFWSSSINYDGYFDICRAFDSSHERSKRIFQLYTSVLQKYQKEGFASAVLCSSR